MKKLLRIILVFTSLLILYSCGKHTDTVSENKSLQDKKVKISVSIPPLKWITQKIAGDDFIVTSITESNVSPELFDPTVKTIEDLEKSDLYFSFDLFNFEHKLEDAVSDQNKIYNVLENNNTLIKEEENSHNHGDHSHEGYDPHVWFSLDTVASISENIKNTLSEKYPDKKEIFEKNYSDFISEINNFKSEIGNDVKSKKNKTFIIYHPALTYFAKDYDLKQISIEQNGKEPTAQYLKTVINEIKTNNIKLLLVQPQFPKSSTELISKEAPDVKIIEFNPLEENIFTNLKKLTDSLE